MSEETLQAPQALHFVFFVPYVPFVALKRENPVITDWVHVSGGSTEGTLGR